MKKYTLLLILLFALNNTQAQPGTLDNSFGSDGKVTTVPYYAALHSYASLLQKDGKIIIAGDRGVSLITDTANTGFTLIRYTSSGKIDSSFGIDGMAIINFHEYASERIISIVAQSDGKILTCGDGYYGYPIANYNGLAIRLNPNGYHNHRKQYC